MILVVSQEEGRNLSQFMQDQERARQRISTLEQQTKVFLNDNKVVPAAAHLRTARLPGICGASKKRKPGEFSLV